MVFGSLFLFNYAYFKARQDNLHRNVSVLLFSEDLPFSTDMTVWLVTSTSTKESFLCIRKVNLLNVDDVMFLSSKVVLVIRLCVCVCVCVCV